MATSTLNGACNIYEILIQPDANDRTFFRYNRFIYFSVLFSPLVAVFLCLVVASLCTRASVRRSAGLNLLSDSIGVADFYFDGESIRFLLIFLFNTPNLLSH